MPILEHCISTMITSNIRRWGGHGGTHVTGELGWNCTFISVALSRACREHFPAPRLSGRSGGCSQTLPKLVQQFAHISRREAEAAVLTRCRRICCGWQPCCVSVPHVRHRLFKVWQLQDVFERGHLISCFT